MIKNLSYLLLGIALLTGCGNQPKDIEIEGFNAYQWQRDKFGCGNRRAAMLGPLLDSQEKLLNLSEGQVIASFGKPDGQELYGRGQKFLIYLTEPNVRCRARAARPNRPEKVTSLYIRIDALGRVNEVFTEQF